MVVCNRAGGRHAVWPIGIIFICAFGTNTANADSLPQGYAPATLEYLVDKAGTFATLQAALAAAKVNVDYAWLGNAGQVTFGQPFACPSVFYLNGSPESWCVSFSGTYSSGGLVSDNLYGFASTVIACKLSDGTIQYGTAYKWPNVPADYQGGVIMSETTGADGRLNLFVACKEQTALTASIAGNPRQPVIPAGSSVQNGTVLTRDWLTVTVTDGSGGSPAAGIRITLQSSRPQSDNIMQPLYPTDQAGETAGVVDTRGNDNGAMSIITATGNNVRTIAPANIMWLPARYEQSFEVTCYAIPPESDFMKSPLVGAPGIPGKKFHHEFLVETAINGTGEALDGTYIHYHEDGWYKIESCPRTFTGVCATDGVTVAVDPTVVPLHGELSIDTVGDRTAQDTGGNIKGYHIDSYWGTRFDECLDTWANPDIGVTFLHYGVEN